MIKTNLSMSHKPVELPVVAGVDLNMVNFRLVAVVFLLGFFLPDYLLTPGWQDELVGVRAEIAELQKQDKELNKEKAKYRFIEDQIKELEVQEKRLTERLKIVKSIIKTRKTPLNILVYIAKNIPEDLWVSKLEISQDKFTIEGKSLSFQSVGKFMGALRASIFFKKDLRMSSTKAEENKETGVRLETFGVTASISRFE